MALYLMLPLQKIRGINLMSNRQQRKQNKMYRRMGKHQQILFDDYISRTTIDAHGNISVENIPPEDYIATSVEQLPQELQEKWRLLNAGA